MEVVGYLRFSGEGQRGNSSLDRQDRDILEMAEEEGWAISRWITDDAVSASTGDNIRKGALGVFVAECEAGGGHEKILVLECQDRLSRINEIDFFEWFIRVLRTGLTVAFADNRMIVDLQSFRNQKRQMRLILDNAEEASRYTEKLGRRVRAAWQRMREEGKPVHCRWTCPAWLELTPDRTTFLDDTPRAIYRIALINEIFDLHIAGMGFAEMERLLNARGEPTWRGGNGWRKSALKRIINGRSVLGEYQHCVRRKPVGDPVPNYFPQVVSNLKWQAANSPAHKRIIASHSKRKLTNLLSDIGACSECGSRLLFRNKSREKQGRPVAYLQCDNASRRLGCSSRKMTPYYPLEKLVLDTLLTRALDDQHFQNDDEIASTNRRIADQRRLIEDADKTISNCAEAISRFGDSPDVMTEFEIRLRTASADRDTAMKSVALLREQLATAHGRASRAEHVKRVDEIRTDLTSQNEQRANAAGLLVKAALNDLVKTIYVSPSSRPRLEGLPAILQKFSSPTIATAILRAGIGIAFFQDSEAEFFDLLKRDADRSTLSSDEVRLIEGYLKRVG